MRQDSIANLPAYGDEYAYRPITIKGLAPPENLVGTLFNIANIMRSHGINDEHQRYKETVKLLLARYCDEKQAAESPDGALKLQVYNGSDSAFLDRVNTIYRVSARRYSKAVSLFRPVKESELDENTLMDMVRLIQGINFSAASNETMQQVFMSFVPSVFKKSLDQYFTPITLIETMVAMVDIGPNDRIADPAMGTADFLTAAMAYRHSKGDSEVTQRVFGIDSDQKAYDLAIINMILNHDGQANLLKADSLEKHDLWANEMDVVLCNPPFGARTQEKRWTVLANYDLAHVWTESQSKWTRTDAVQPSQQLGILFIERCYKMLADGGRLAIILPEGYLCTPSYGYVRQWILEHLQILTVVELPRRIFVKSDADLRSNILVAKKLSQGKLKSVRDRDYPIHSDLVRKVGYKMGKGYSLIPLRDNESGFEIRDASNRLVLDSDFTAVLDGYRSFQRSNRETWAGARVTDILNHPQLDMKPRRLHPKALENLRRIKSGNFIPLSEVADVVEDTIDLVETAGASSFKRLIEGQDIRAIEGVVIPQDPSRCWDIAERKSAKVVQARHRDIVIGLVRPERRNIGLLLTGGDDLVATPGGVSLVRVKPSKEAEFPTEWVFATLRSEACRLQFWTESGGTSYGKLTPDHIKQVVLPVVSKREREGIRDSVKEWARAFSDSLRKWGSIGSEEDRRPILNSPLHGLKDDAED